MGDEFHFMSECYVLNELRNKYLLAYYFKYHAYTYHIRTNTRKTKLTERTQASFYKKSKFYDLGLVVTMGQLIN